MRCVIDGDSQILAALAKWATLEGKDAFPAVKGAVRAVELMSKPQDVIGPVVIAASTLHVVDTLAGTRSATSLGLATAARVLLDAIITTFRVQMSEYNQLADILGYPVTADDDVQRVRMVFAVIFSNV